MQVAVHDACANASTTYSEKGGQACHKRKARILLCVQRGVVVPANSVCALCMPAGCKSQPCHGNSEAMAQLRIEEISCSIALP